MKKLIIIFSLAMFVITAINFNQIQLGESIDLTVSGLINSAKADGETQYGFCFSPQNDSFYTYYDDACNYQKVDQTICWLGGNAECWDGFTERTTMDCITHLDGYYTQLWCSL